MPVETNFYETIFIANGKLSEEEFNDLVNKYKRFIRKSSGRVRRSENMGKKKLAYEIKDNNEGWYEIIAHESPWEMIAKLEMEFKSDDNVLKFMTMKINEDEAALEYGDSYEEDEGEEAKSEQAAVANPYKPSNNNIDAYDVILGKAKYN